MRNIIIKLGYSALSYAERESWCSLFSGIYRKSIDEAYCVLRKYEQENAVAVFCLGYSDDVLVASYSGLIFRATGAAIFVSMDTMSSGVIRNATVELARKLYPVLAENAVDAVCGFPNSNILNIRKRKLKWEMTARMYAYIGIPFLWRFGVNKRNRDILGWYIDRPMDGYIGKKIPFVRLLGRNGLYAGQFFSIVLGLGPSRPGIFFVQVPSFLIEPKQFGYLVLDADKVNVRSLIEEMSNWLDLNSIDVP